MSAISFVSAFSKKSFVCTLCIPIKAGHMHVFEQNSDQQPSYIFQETYIAAVVKTEY